MTSRIRFVRSMVKAAAVANVPKHVDHFSKFSPSPLSMKQFLDFGKWILRHILVSITKETLGICLRLILFSFALQFPRDTSLICNQTMCVCACVCVKIHATYVFTNSKTIIILNLSWSTVNHDITRKAE